MSRESLAGSIISLNQCGLEPVLEDAVFESVETHHQSSKSPELTFEFKRSSPVKKENQNIPSDHQKTKADVTQLNVAPTDLTKSDQSKSQVQTTMIASKISDNADGGENRTLKQSAEAPVRPFRRKVSKNP